MCVRARASVCVCVCVSMDVYIYAYRLVCEVKRREEKKREEKRGREGKCTVRYWRTGMDQPGPTTRE